MERVDPRINACGESESLSSGLKRPVGEPRRQELDDRIGELLRPIADRDDDHSAAALRDSELNGVDNVGLRAVPDSAELADEVR